MPKPGSGTTYKYSDHFKATAVHLSQLPAVAVPDVSPSLYISPFKLCRWRKEVREGKLMHDNAYIEWWNKTMKADLYHRHDFISDGQLDKAMRSYIHLYNNERLPSSLRYKTPMKVEGQCTQAACVHFFVGAPRGYQWLCLRCYTS